ncbi:Glucosylceramidase [Aphelenchoides fujianensis]|nr:Glucosylceramidase [Aphelenchoides fujianensis]
METLLPLLLIAASISTAYSTKCEQRRYDQDSFVCVCTAKKCDHVEPVGQLDAKTAVVYSTGPRYRPFGSTHRAITDSAMVVLKRAAKADSKLADQLRAQYYGKTGIEYSLGRVPIASCDFSLSNWSYLDTPNDWELETFNLTEIDREKAAFLRKAIEETNGTLRLFGSPWSAPWMKDSKTMQGGRLIQASNHMYERTYAHYFRRTPSSEFPFWGLTVQNEPSGSYGWQAMLMSSEEQRAFVQDFLGPVLKSHWVTKDLKIMAHDDGRGGALAASRVLYSKEPSFIDGVGVHWYGLVCLFSRSRSLFGHKVPLSPASMPLRCKAGHDQGGREAALDRRGADDGGGGEERSGGMPYRYDHAKFESLTNLSLEHPEKFVLATEACNAYGNSPTDHRPHLGSWEFAANYAHDIVQSLRNYVAGWVDWNIFLDEFGGPNWTANFIFNSTGAEFFKQPIKFIPPGSVRVQIKVDGFAGEDGDWLEAVAFETPAKNFVVVLHNRHDVLEFKVAVGVDGQTEKYADVRVPPKSLRTVVWRAPFLQYESRLSVKIDFKPASLGVILKAAENKPPLLCPAKASTCGRTSSDWPPTGGVNFRHASNPMERLLKANTAKTNRFLTAVRRDQPADLRKAMRGFWHRFYVDDKNIYDEADIRAVCAEQKIANVDLLLQAAESEEIKAKFRQLTNEAVEIDAFGVPFMILEQNGKTAKFFGTDRLPLLFHELGVKFEGPLTVRSHI